MSKTIHACGFGRGAWRAEDWWMVQSPRWDRANAWIQEDDHIRSAGPENEPGQTYTSMVLRTPLTGDFTMTATMSFDERVAPLLVVGDAPALRADGRREYRDHHELVLFDEGINLWDHRWAEGHPSWTLAARWRFPVAARRRYRLALTVTAQRFDIFLDGRPVGTHPGRVRRPLHVGLTACEGTNRFYDIRVEPAPGGASPACLPLPP